MLNIWHLLDEFQIVWGTRTDDHFDCASRWAQLLERPGTVSSHTVTY